MDDDEQETISALVPRSLSWNDDAVALRPAQSFIDVVAEAVVWQNASHDADQVAVFALLRSVNSGAALDLADDAERVQELLGIMGGIGEQLVLAWTAQQDAQRLVMTQDNRRSDQHQIVLRATAELSSHFLLAVCHGLGNLVLRVVILDETARSELSSKRFFKGTTFEPYVDERKSWPTFNFNLVRDLEEVTKASNNSDLLAMITELRSLVGNQKFMDLEERRGLDFHRRRPQSLSHTSHPSASNPLLAGQKAMGVGRPTADPKANAMDVLRVVTDAIPIVGQSMKNLATLLGPALRGFGISIHTEDRFDKQRQDVLDSDVFDPPPEV